MARPDPPSTRRLVRLAREGDREAVNELLGRMRPRLLAWVAARLGPRLRSRLEAEDVVQEVLLQADAALPAYEHRDARGFYAWLFAIAEHGITAAADRWGAAKRDAGRERDLPSRLAGSGTSPSSAAARREEAELVRDALQELPERYRAVFRLRRIEFRDNDEAARILGVTPGNASVLYVRAVKALEERVEARRTR